jgi:hypothetical protein
MFFCIFSQYRGNKINLFSLAGSARIGDKCYGRVGDIDLK